MPLAFVCAAIYFGPDPAEAHTAFKTLGSFWSGALHVLTSFDQMGLLLALAIWASLQTQRRDAPVVGAVCLGSLFGSLISWAVGAQFDTLFYTSALMVVIGVAGAVALDAVKGVLVVIAASGGALIGITSEINIEGLQRGLIALGAAIAAASTTSYGLIGIAPALPGWMRVAVRAAASWIAAIGLMVFALEYSQLHGHG